MRLFLDACALAKRYLLEQESSRTMKQITGRFNHRSGLIVSSFIEVEVISALAKYAREHPNYSGEFLRRHPAVVDQFRKDLSRDEFAIIWLDQDMVEEASELLKRHPEYAIHAGDAVHLATALSVRARLASGEPLVFVTADCGLERAARAEGLPTLNPLHQGIDLLEQMIHRSN
jgi:predicted nucleic acid-binding protein